MYDLSKHPYFEEYKDPKTGVVSYILKERVGELQQNLYFTEFGGITADEEYMWFVCREWPKTSNTLAVVSLNPEKPYIRRFEGTGNGMPGGGCNVNMCKLDGNCAYFPVDSAMYKVDVEGNISKVLEVDKNFIGNRRLDRLATHLTVNANNELYLLDMHVGGKTYVATVDVKTGEMKHIAKFMRNYNHGMFSPTDPELFILDEDWEFDPISGERFDVDKRIWVMDIHGTKLEPIVPENWFRHNNSIYCHDFWSQDGWICIPDILENIYEYNVYTKEMNMVWKRSICHAHTLYRKYWVGDDSPYRWNPQMDCKVWFFDRESGKEIEIYSALPYPKHACGAYHLDPHPAFSPKGSYVVTLTTVHGGRADISVTPTDALIKKCREEGTKVE